MFFWGRDVIHPDGNLLREYGFERRKSEGLDGTSCYRMEYQGDIIELHGVCAGRYSRNQDSFLFTRHPNQCSLYDDSEPPVPGYHAKELRRQEPLDDLLEASRRFLQWWLEYEAWIATRTDRRYRNGCFRAFGKLPKSKSWLPPDRAEAWLRSYFEAPEQLRRSRAWKNDASLAR